MLNQRATIILVTAIGAALLAFVLSCLPNSTLTRAELGARDILVNYGRHTAANPKLIFLAIDGDSIALESKEDLHRLFDLGDDATLEKGALALMSERWPWPRSVYALVLERLMAAGAKTVVFDLTFPKPSDDDESFRAALQKYGDRVVLGSNFIDSSTGEASGINATLAMPTEALLPRDNTPDSRVGFVNFWPDPDGVVREAQFQTSFAQFLGSRRIEGEPIYTSLAAQAVRKYGQPDGVAIDAISKVFRYTAEPQKGFRPHSIFEIFVPEYWQRNYRSGAVFDNALVVIGAAGNWQHDEHQTPYGSMAGPEIQLNVINALLQNEFLKPVPRQVSIAILVLAGLIAVVCATWCQSPSIRFGLFLGITLAWIGVQLPLFDRGILAPIVGPLAVFAVTGVCGFIYDFIRASAEQLRLRLALNERKRAQEILQTANEELERRVAERTSELTESNSALTGLLNEKIVLLKEVHHRVKNNLQIISSLLNLQSGYIKDPIALGCFNESRHRVRSMALIHEKLYQSQDLSKVDFQDYLKTLVSGLQASFSGRSSSVQMTVAAEEIMLGVDVAVPCGLIVNELVTNCFKYAFGNGPGEIAVAVKRATDSKLQLTVSDNGIGFPKGLDFRNTESLGLQVVTTLADQLEATINLRNGTGTTFEITFPETNPQS